MGSVGRFCGRGIGAEASRLQLRLKERDVSSLRRNVMLCFLHPDLQEGQMRDLQVEAMSFQSEGHHHFRPQRAPQGPFRLFVGASTHQAGVTAGWG